MKITILALVASLSIAFVAPGIASADVGANTGDKNVTAPKGPTGKVPSTDDKNANVPGDADKNAKVPTGKPPVTADKNHGKAPKVKLPKGKMALAKPPVTKHMHGKNDAKHS